MNFLYSKCLKHSSQKKRVLQNFIVANSKLRDLMFKSKAMIQVAKKQHNCSGYININDKLNTPPHVSTFLKLFFLSSQRNDANFESFF